MKKNNIIFIGECVIIAVLLVVIGFLLRDSMINKKYHQDAMLAVEEASIEEKKIEEEDKISEDFFESLHVQEEISLSPSENSLSETDNENSSFPLNTKDVIEENKKTQIVVFGDSIWNAGRGSDGISEQIMSEKDVIIYNCSIGGTSAAVYNESVEWDSWTSKSFNGMMYLVNGAVSEELIADDAAYSMFNRINFENVDYIIVSYGLNDYFLDVPIFPKEYFDLTSYVGALRHGIHKIKEAYPHIEFILTSPTYCGWFEGERQFGLGDYVEAARGVAAEYETYFLDMYHALGKNPQEKSEYLEDGVHLTPEGRELYAKMVIDFFTEKGID